MESNSQIKSSYFSKKFKLELFLLGLGLGVVATGLVLGISFVYSYRNKFYPGIHIDNVLVAGLSREEAQNLLDSKAENLMTYQVKINVDDVSIASSSGQLQIKRDYSTAINTAFE
ncbi:MAG: hypothetical protein ABFQ62_01915, partial [Patescibacteria group bacterium]